MVGVQRGREVEQLARADADEVAFELEFRPVGDGDARGPYVQGRPRERFVYLSWVASEERQMFRRAKLMLADIPPAVWSEAHAGGRMLEGALGLTDGCGGPLCARVPAAAVTWTAVADAGSSVDERSS